MFYDPPFVTVKTGRKCVRLPGSRTYSQESRVAKSSQPLDCQGDFATLVKFQGVAVSESAAVDAHKGQRRSQEVKDSADLALAWKYATSKAAWLRLSARLGRMAAALRVSDPEFYSDLEVLKLVALHHAINQ